MKVHILSADAKGRIEGVLHRDILMRIANRMGSPGESDVVIVPVSYFHDFSFNRHLDAIGRKPVVVMDFMEHYALPDLSETPIFGAGTKHAPELSQNPQWHSFDRWASSANVVLYFKRELFSGDESNRVLPIEWPCYLPAWPEEPKANFDARPFELFFNWGMSNCLRPLFHGQAFTESCKLGYEVISSFDHIDAKINQPGRKWISIHSPHTHRMHIDRIAVRQAQSKMSVSMPGAGVKCFRSTEHLVHTVPVKCRDRMKWSMPWSHGVNCLEIDPSENMAAQVNHFAQREDLHDLYRAAQELSDRYRVHRYTSEYVVPNILLRL